MPLTGAAASAAFAKLSSVGFVGLGIQSGKTLPAVIPVVRFP